MRYLFSGQINRRMNMTLYDKANYTLRKYSDYPFEKEMKSQFISGIIHRDGEIAIPNCVRNVTLTEFTTSNGNGGDCLNFGTVKIGGETYEVVKENDSKIWYIN
jgi:hypothetical protein